MSVTQTHKNQVYVDYAGSSLYRPELINTIMADLLSNTYANPHSQSPSSTLTSNMIEQTRHQVLEFFNTNSDEYSVVFTSGCTAALKLLAETFTFMDVEESNKTETDGGCFCYLLDNHTSVQGMREIAIDKRAKVICLNTDQLYQADLSDAYLQSQDGNNNRGNSLFVYPAQSNFSGHRYPLDWIADVKSKKFPFQHDFSEDSWFTCLDAASFVSTSHLDLQAIKPDFLAISFYKIFGYPTGLGALLVHHQSVHVLKKKYFGGGTVAVSTPQKHFHQNHSALHEAFEDGTLPFLDIISLYHCFNSLDRLFGGISNISERTFKVAQQFHHQLSSLKHANGKPVAKIYCHGNFEDPLTQGPIVTFNVLTQNEDFIGYSVVAKMAATNNIHLRVGCFCNIGACQIHLGITTDQLIKNFQAGHVCGDEKDMVDGYPTGAVRISFGSSSTESDAEECIKFIQKCFINKQVDFTSLVPQPTSLSLPHLPADKTCQELPSTSLEAKKEISSDIISISHSPDIEEKYFPASTTRRILSDLVIYPVKSCAGMKVTKWPINPSGLLHDREWMVVTERGIALTQKRLPQLCFIQPDINLANNTLTLHYPGIPPLQLSLDFHSAGNEERNKDYISKVCFKKVHGIDCGEKASDWLSQALGEHRYHLFRLYPKSNQAGNEESKMMSLSNHGQYSLVTQASLRALFEKVHQSQCNESEDFEEFTSRFRSNFVISGGVVFEEKFWKTIRIGSVNFINGKESSRCQMICVNQKTAERTSEPLASLFTWIGNKVNFGVYFDADSHLGEQILSSGAEVVITSVKTEDKL